MENEAACTCKEYRDFWRVYWNREMSEEGRSSEWVHEEFGDHRVWCPAAKKVA